MQQLNLKPTHAPVKAYYQALGQYGQLNIDHEMAVRSAFQRLLEKCGNQFHWTLVAEFPISRPKASPLKVDGALLDEFKLKRGLWEAKDEHDDLEKEAKRKITAGYPTDNIIFQAPERAILYQNGIRQGLDEDISSPDNLVELLHHFFEYREPQHQEWEDAVEEFKERLPQIAAGAKQLIDDERKKNPAFVQNFDAFYALCQQAINPNLSEDAVEGMLIQHLLTERIFRKIFDNPDFSRRNIIALEIEKVIASLTSRHFNRDTFLESLDRFYRAIEVNAENTTGFAEKQAFLNSVYERFFQGYSPKEADVRGIVYTPQSIVEFMVRSVESILHEEFGRSLSGKEVHILDPFVGTGNFIVRVMKEIKKTALPYKYENELHCNEVVLMPYYIASMNIEHAYLEATGEYLPFPGICLVDTFELAEPRQWKRGFMTEENTKRVARQKQAPIFVIIGNPPYNAGQVDENDKNKNRKYEETDASIDNWVSDTYVKSSVATLRNSLGDPYVKAIRWASDRIGAEGIVAFVSNNSFLDNISFDGMRKHLEQDFSKILHVNFKGNARTSGERRKKEGGNIFDDAIRVGVGITFFIRNKKARTETAQIWVHSVPDYDSGEKKKGYLDEWKVIGNAPLRHVQPDAKHTWLTAGQRPEFVSFVPLACRAGKSSAIAEPEAIFKIFSNGVKTNNDAYVYGFARQAVADRAKAMVDEFNSELDRWRKEGRPDDLDKLDKFLKVDEKVLKWIRNTKRTLRRDEEITFDPSKIPHSVYRPFTKLWYYFERTFSEDTYRFPLIFPTPDAELENRVICAPGVGGSTSYWTLCTNLIPSLSIVSIDANQCFPFYIYDEEGSNRRENITDWAFQKFRSQYQDPSITKWDIFHYVYGLRHHQTYKDRYAANLRRELPRIPLSPDFRAFANAGQRLVDLHVNYEVQSEFGLEQVEKTGEKLDLRGKKMTLSKDQTAIIYNDFLTLKGIPPAALNYQVGNRSALEWVIEQYQVSKDKRSGIPNDPNRPDDPDYILRLIGKVITVSLETNKIVHALPALGV